MWLVLVWLGLVVLDSAFQLPDEGDGNDSDGSPLQKVNVVVVEENGDEDGEKLARRCDDGEDARTEGSGGYGDSYLMQ